MGRLFNDEFCQLLDTLNDYDSKLKRETEDVYDLLVEKNVISFEEIPQAARTVMTNKKSIRNRLSTLYNAFNRE